ncbi:MAG TPA: glycoside hydrolase family 43 protein [Verrucomicrobiae bacterium]
MRFLILLLAAAFCASAQEKFQNPINRGADPWLVCYDGQYYLTTTQGDSIRMWKSPSLGGLKTASPITVWKDADPSRSRGVWAPEFHLFDNHWYLYYTATTSDSADDKHRLFVLESQSNDPTGPYTYKARIFNPTNDLYAIDPTLFKNAADGKLYFLWAARPGHVLYIARMKNPWTLDGNGVYIPADGFGCKSVREGPEILRRNGKIFLIYSMCSADTPDYKLGMLIADENSNLLDPASWKQYPRPVFERDDANGVFGPGHNGFFQSPDGTQDWIVYHAKSGTDISYRDRTTRVQQFTWNPDGTPNFGTPLPLSAELNEPSAKK